jgi:hypothetical protein
MSQEVDDVDAQLIWEDQAMSDKDTSPRERFRNDPDPRKRFADVFIDGVPVVSEPLPPLDGDEPDAPKHPDDLEDAQQFLEQSPRAHPMEPGDRLAEGEIQVTFGRWIKNPRHRS